MLLRDSSLSSELEIYYDAALRDSTALMRSKNCMLFGFLVFKISYLMFMSDILGKTSVTIAFGFYFASAVVTLSCILAQNYIVKKGVTTAKATTAINYFLAIFSIVGEA